MSQLIQKNMLHINVKLEKRHRNTPPERYKITRNYLTRREVTGFRGGGVGEFLVIKSDSEANVTLQIREIVALSYYELELPPKRLFR